MRNIPFRYEILDEFEQVIAATITKWTAECLLAGMKASGSPTWGEGRYSIQKIDPPIPGGTPSP